jgi:hypothetical protein
VLLVASQASLGGWGRGVPMTRAPEKFGCHRSQPVICSAEAWNLCALQPPDDSFSRPFLKSTRENRIASRILQLTQRSFSTTHPKAFTSYLFRRAIKGCECPTSLLQMSGALVPFRPQNAQDWELYKEAITSFYNAMELRGPHGVMQAMEHEYNFKATYIQFHRISLLTSS